MKKVELTANALQVAQSRYFMNGEDWLKASERVANTIAIAEIKDREKYKTEYTQMIYNMDFLPGGRILRNCGRARGSLFNCYHLPIGDSIEEIGQFIKDSLILWSEGGGVGCNFTPLRPKGDPILGKGGKSSGLVSFIEAADAVSHTIESGGARRAAAIAHVDVSHPEIIDFIDAKMIHGKLEHFNISVSVTDDFLEAVEADAEWIFKFKQQKCGSMPARTIWNKIVTNMVQSAEPGLLNWSNFKKNNSYYFEPVLGTNPCHTGDTFVSVADGRKLISFKQLADEGNDVPVFSKNDKTGLVEVKMMRHPRKTGKQVKIYKVNLDNGMSFRCNEKHQVDMFDGSKKHIIDLQKNDRLHHMIKYTESLEKVLNKDNTSKGEYVWINTGFGKNYSEHRIVAEYNIGRKLLKNEVVHHINYIYDDNGPNNLEVMKKVDHDIFHSKDMLGKNNPMNRFPEKNYFKTHKFCGIKNGNSKGYTLQDIEISAILFCKDIKRRPTVTEWKKYCENIGLPFWSSEVLSTFKSIGKFLDFISEKADVEIYNKGMLRSYKKYLNIKSKTDLNIFFDNGIKVRKICENENCNVEIIVPWDLRERCFCSRKCFNSSERKINSLMGNKHAQGNNFRVISVIEDGIEDVYNGTVDDNHNYYVYVGKDQTKSGKPKSHFINSKNCGETTLGPYGVCDLGSIVLPNFITGNINTNWRKLEHIIKLGVRFLDDVIDVNKYALRKIDTNAHKSRRIGIGVIGLAEYLFAKKLKYGSEKAVAETERLMRFIRDVSYQASMEISIEKGAFPQFDPIPYGKASFIRKLPAQLRMDVKKYGVRNCTIMALAPTGTISLLADYTSAIEPLFAKAMIRKDRVSERIYVHPKYQQIIKNNEEIPEWFVDSYDLKPKDHFEMQVACQKFCDGAVSKTINLPKETTDEDLSNLLLEYIHDLKGCTVYRDGSREGQILNQVTDDQVRAYMANKKVENNLDEEQVQCRSGSCDL